jgi:hypothetical protein
MQSVPITTKVLSFNFEIQYKPAEQLIVPDSLSRGFGFMVFNATFNNISVIWWWSVLLVEETRAPLENHFSTTLFVGMH